MLSDFSTSSCKSFLTTHSQTYPLDQIYAATKREAFSFSSVSSASFSSRASVHRINTSFFLTSPPHQLQEFSEQPPHTNLRPLALESPERVAGAISNVAIGYFFWYSWSAGNKCMVDLTVSCYSQPIPLKTLPAPLVRIIATLRQLYTILPNCINSAASKFSIYTKPTLDKCSWF